MQQQQQQQQQPQRNHHENVYTINYAKTHLKQFERFNNQSTDLNLNLKFHKMKMLFKL